MLISQLKEGGKRFESYTVRIQNNSFYFYLIFYSLEEHFSSVFVAFSLRSKLHQHGIDSYMLVIFCSNCIHNVLSK